VKFLLTEITYFGKPCLVTCDHNCKKAWGMNGRDADEGTQIVFDEDDPDDMAYVEDSKVGDAPDDPGTYEGIGNDGGKPMHPDLHNKWCARECERSQFIEPGEQIEVRDFTQPFYNIPSRHGVENAKIELGGPYTPSVPFEHKKSWFVKVKQK
jgi:hypothetical protein